jgi:4-hydroxymandelate oxidase
MTAASDRAVANGRNAQLSLRPLQPLPEGIANLADYEQAARARLAAPLAAWLFGDDAALTPRANRAAWDERALAPRLLRPLAGGGSATRLLGRALPWPVLLAPAAYQRLLHADGELASAVAAAAQGAGYVAALLASTPPEAIARAFLPGAEAAAAHSGPLWLQLYLGAVGDGRTLDFGCVRELVARAEAAGYEALVLTADAPVRGPRTAERRSRFAMPPDIDAAHLRGLARRAAASTAGGLCGGLVGQAPTWADVERLAASTRLPLLLKGVLRADDALQALACGCAGVIVSNHGGRTLDGACATARALPRIADALAPTQAAVLVDGGIRHGTDIVKALALGAHAVLLGRPYLAALACGGAAGVAHALRLLRDEFEIALAQCGCATPAQLTRDLLDDAAHPHLPASPLPSAS